ncbi:MAG: SpoIID/LytB domain-containing protein [Planctomycetota bacterium]|jgi:stage II sporulation protein D
MDSQATTENHLDHAALTRRQALGRLSLAACAPVVLAGCGSDSSAPERAEATDAPDTPGEGPTVAVPEQEPVVRVRVLRVRRQRDEAEIGAPQQWLRVGATDDPQHPFVVRGPVTARLDAGEWSIVDSAGGRHQFQTLRTIDIATIDPRHSTLSIGDRTYPGSLRLAARTDEGQGAYDVVNHVTLEAYLPGVVARELFNHWHLETHMAQAIAARSFACTEQAFFRKRHYDLTNTTRSQVYVGSVTHQRAIDAVAMTRGRLLAFEGGVVPGYYCSCCGGVSALASDAIGSNPINTLRPLRGRGLQSACSNAPVYSWEVVRAVDRLSDGLLQYGRRAGVTDLGKVGSLKAISIRARNPHGRPTRYAVVGAGGTEIELSAEQMRRAINAAGAGTASARTLRSSNFTVQIESGVATIRGHGFGHGVGLCQYGSQAMAQQGSTHDQILGWYYPDVEIADAYG